MAEALNVVPKDTSPGTGIRDVDKVAEALADVVADTYRLTVKTHAIHWNVEGPLFHAVHEMTEEQYEDMFEAVDDLAERVRALGRLTPMNFSALLDSSVVAEVEGKPTAGEMVESLAEDHARVAKRMHALAELAGGQRDIVTEDLAVNRSAFHEKTAWMLRAIARG
jgi:starvation-inducible DNA-binding protein